MEKIRRASFFIFGGAIVDFVIGVTTAIQGLTNVLYDPVGWITSWFFFYFFISILSLLHILSFSWQQGSPSTTKQTNEPSGKKSSTKGNSSSTEAEKGVIKTS